MNQHVTKVLAACLLLAPITAMGQSNDGNVITIDNAAIVSTLQEQVPAIAKAHSEYGLSHLLRHINQDVSETTSKKLNLPKASAKALAPEDLYAERMKGVLMFGNFYDCGRCDRMHVGVSATATVISPDGWCLTNFHVVADIVQHNEDALKGDSLYYVADYTGHCYPVTEIAGYSRGADLALIKVDTRGDKLQPIPLGTPARTGARVHMIGHPKQQFYYYTQGAVARNSRYDFGNGMVSYRMEITADYAVGASGGPILDDCGNLVGIVGSTVGLYSDDEQKTDQQMVLKATIPLRSINELLKR